ncbi:phosphatidylglycerol:prolipoprotein diacylglycerol transferase [Eubacterium ruminantium]|nr:phosphatidylglycerol:prolipoprotein diacylglycerol transferase [Eubacterium ruminantium]
MNGIYFPGIGIKLGNVPSGFKIFGIEIKLYAVVIAVGFILALLIAAREAKMSGQDEETYLDFFLWLIIPCIIGARIYYVIFSWDEYYQKGKGFWKTFVDIINIREGGLAIYGGLIVGVLVAFIFNKVKKLSLPLMGDTVCMGVLVGQILGRWGNFFNREVFGAYTDSFIRMAIPVDYFANEGTFDGYLDSGIITNEMLLNPEMVNGKGCITVYPAFLLEGLWNLAILILILLYRRNKKFDGELSLMYIMGYGAGRCLVESIRTDSLMAGSFKVSQLVAILCFAGAFAILIWNRIRIARGAVLANHPVMSRAEWKKYKAELKAADSEKSESEKETSADASGKSETEKKKTVDSEKSESEKNESVDSDKPGTKKKTTTDSGKSSKK